MDADENISCMNPPVVGYSEEIVLPDSLSIFDREPSTKADDDVPVSAPVDGNEDSVDDCANAPEVDHKLVEPDATLVDAIVKQMEYYFSNENLPLDNFLLKQVAKNPFGFVSLNTIRAFRKMRKIGKNLEIVRLALSHSSKLEVSKDGTKVRRVHSLPSDQNVVTRMVVAINLPEPATVSSINELFSACDQNFTIHLIISSGEFITTVDVRRHIRAAVDSDRGKATTGIAFIEFDTEESAKSACGRFNSDAQDWRSSASGVRVTMLKATKSSNEKDADSRSQAEKGSRLKSEKDSNGSATHGRLADIARSSESRQNGSDRHGSFGSRKSRDSPKLGRASKDQSEVDQSSTDSNGVNPWLLRRMKACQLKSDGEKNQETSDPTAGDCVASERKSMPQLTAVRQPRGPDGTKGFALVRM